MTVISEKVGGFTLLLSDDKREGRWCIENMKALLESNIRLPEITVDQVEILSDKWRFRHLCSEYGLNVPREVKPIKGTKFVVKPIGTARRGGVLETPLLVVGERSWKQFASMELDLENHYIESYIDGYSVYYCGAYRRGKKVLSFVQRNVHQQPGGRSIVAAIPHTLPREIESRIDSMIESLKWDSVLMVELRCNEEDQQFYAIECNPRFWGPLQLAVDNGYNFPAVYLGCDEYPKSGGPLFGYRWASGYIRGLSFTVTDGAPFEIHSTVDLETTVAIKPKDLWFRRDTFPYFFWDLTLSVGALVKRALGAAARFARQLIQGGRREG